MTEQMTNRSRWLALVIVCVGYLMIVLDVTIVGVALPSIREDLGFSESSLAWVANAYLLTFGGFSSSPAGWATSSGTGDSS
jgi:MFS family permease